jgi:hypothetical protein
VGECYVGELQFNNGRVPVKVWTEAIEPQAIQQLLNVAQLPDRPCSRR